MFNQAFNVGCTAHNYRMRDIAEIVAEVVPGCRIEMAPDAGPDKRSYRVSFDKIARVLPGVQAAMGRATRGRAALCRLSPIRADARRVRGPALSAHQPHPAADERRRSRAGLETFARRTGASRGIPIASKPPRERSVIFTETRLKGAFVIELERREDDRGFFARSFCQRSSRSAG